MEAKLKSIEEKLDIIIAAMSVNPDFEKYVKQGLLNLHLTKFEKQLKQNDSDVIAKKAKFILDNLQIHSYQFDVIQSGLTRFNVKGLGSNQNAPEFAKELIDKAASQLELVNWDTDKWSYNDFVEDTLSKDGFCQLTKAKLNLTFGEPIDIQSELEKERLKCLEENK